MKRSLPLLGIFILMLAFAPFAYADVSNKSDYSPEQALQFSQSAIGRTLANYAFTDSQGKAVSMADFLGKPLVVSFIYTSCADSCPVITQTLADAAASARDALGDDSFNVISIGFDSASDSPDRMRYFANGQGIDVSGWKFLSGDLATMIGFAENLGFIFYPSAKGFDHLSQVTVVDGKGVVYRQVYGQNFDLPLLVEPLKELVFGTKAPFASIGDLIKKVRLFCTIYDPAADRYRFDYSIFIQLFVGTMVVGGMFIFVVREWWRIWRTRRRKKTLPHHQSSV
ncbi:MAG: SCO family protein [Rhodospirillales bacterium]|nr:SCO family protein [Rhodospirillales bacterium]